MNIDRNIWLNGLVIGAVTATLSGALYARDPGINQPGRGSGTTGVGAPGVGVRDPGFNQPGAVGKRSATGVGVGAPGGGVRDPGINQPGAVGNRDSARRAPIDCAIAVALQSTVTLL